MARAMHFGNSPSSAFPFGALRLLECRWHVEASWTVRYSWASEKHADWYHPPFGNWATSLPLWRKAPGFAPPPHDGTAFLEGECSRSNYLYNAPERAEKYTACKTTLLATRTRA